MIQDRPLIESNINVVGDLCVDNLMYWVSIQEPAVKMAFLNGTRQITLRKESEADYTGITLYNKCLYISDSSRRSVFYIGSPTLIITRTRRSHRVKARNLAISNRSRVSSAHTVTTVFIARQYADARYWYSKSVRPSARLSVTFRYQMKTAQHIVTVFSPYGSPIILVLPASNIFQNSDGVTPCGGAKYRWCIKISRFSTNKSINQSNTTISNAP